MIINIKMVLYRYQYLLIINTKYKDLYLIIIITPTNVFKKTLKKLFHR